MPRGDKTGPQGLGSSTGRAMGFCAGYLVPGYMNSIPGQGRGCGKGLGRRLGMRKPNEEAQALREHANFIKGEMEAINSRIKELEKRGKK